LIKKVKLRFFRLFILINLCIPWFQCTTCASRRCKSGALVFLY